MKKLFIISIIILCAVACKKTKYEPEGPTDIRVKNLSVLSFTEVKVNISDTIKTFGIINPGGISPYIRYPKAFVKAEISAKVNGQLFSTGIVDYTGLNYIGQSKITYEVRISSDNLKLEIQNCSLDAPLK